MQVTYSPHRLLFEGCCSIQLSYGSIFKERIEILATEKILVKLAEKIQKQKHGKSGDQREKRKQ
jgi:hypothetical protein